MTEAKDTKSKYGALIQKARETENQESGKPDDQIADQSETKKAKKSASNGAGRAESQQTIKPDNQKASKPEEKQIEEREVNLCVKVPESLRRHWAAESKRNGITMTEVIVQALEERFGRPE